MYSPDIETLLIDIDFQVKKLEFEVTVTKNLVGILKKANEQKENDPDNDSRGSDPLGEAGAKRKNTV